MNNNDFQSAKVPDSKSQIGTLKITLEEMAIIKVIWDEPSATQKRQLQCHYVNQRDGSLIEKRIAKKQGKLRALDE